MDSVGLLISIYRYGQIAYIGGGLGVGIHNTIEAAVYGIPVIFGPNYKKFKEAKDLIAVGGGFSVSNGEELRQRFDLLLTDEQALAQAGKAAGDLVSQNAGATDVALKMILKA